MLVGSDQGPAMNAFYGRGHGRACKPLQVFTINKRLASCGQKWLARFTPFFSERERRQAGCQHRLFFSQVEFCDNLIFHRRAALDRCRAVAIGAPSIAGM